MCSVGVSLVHLRGVPHLIITPEVARDPLTVKLRAHCMGCEGIRHHCHCDRDHRPGRIRVVHVLCCNHSTLQLKLATGNLPVPVVSFMAVSTNTVEGEFKVEGPMSADHPLIRLATFKFIRLVLLQPQSILPLISRCVHS